MPQIDYYFTCVSPFVYLGHQAIEAVAAKHGCGIAYKPVNIGAIFGNSGAKPLGERPLSRQRYRFLELQRWAAYRDLPINLKPKHFPADPTLADHAVIALLQAKRDPSAFMFSIFSAVWARDENISDPAVVEKYLTEAGFNADQMLAAAQSPDVAAIRARNTEEAIALDVVGLPAYVVQGEVFWGQDRTELVDHALTTGRAPFSQPA
jgi:2-hydroxychromene-2-carboxylate isomerase